VFPVLPHVSLYRTVSLFLFTLPHRCLFSSLPHRVFYIFLTAPRVLYLSYRTGVLYYFTAPVSYLITCRTGVLFINLPHRCLIYYYLPHRCLYWLYRTDVIIIILCFTERALRTVLCLRYLLFTSLKPAP